MVKRSINCGENCSINSRLKNLNLKDLKIRFVREKEMNAIISEMSWFSVLVNH